MLNKPHKNVISIRSISISINIYVFGIGIFDDMGYQILLIFLFLHVALPELLAIKQQYLLVQ